VSQSTNDSAEVEKMVRWWADGPVNQPTGLDQCVPTAVVRHPPNHAIHRQA
jgi:hypothetical protein